MARTRNYAKEKAGLRARVKASGAKSEREYRALRRAANVKRTERAPTVAQIPKSVLAAAKRKALSIERLRKESRDWSNKHSQKPASKYSSRLKPDQVEKYYAAFVENWQHIGPGSHARFLNSLQDYLVPDFMAEDEWEGIYTK